ncbi:tyrosine-type recombinase/integrase [Acinetobacter sp. ANC 4277]|uniref:site-specific integrase n=1 Tax=Acinetobacter terrae TaxID=2731247 RepID=UPI0014906816|nr:tyrosine-type recombinase/integrase [Acinetobacter terrae]NNG77747.1 tyrosine-type recombinase/integrase [Acinetobacter terrae]
MGSITVRKGADGSVNYRAAIRINRKGFPTYSESKTFHSKKLAENWLKKREVEIQESPDILLGKEQLIDLTLSDAIDKYLDEVGNEYGRTKRYSLLLIKKLPIARNIITKIKSVHLAEHVASRKAGIPKLGLEPIATSTQQHELLHIRGVLSHAAVMWDLDIDLNSFDKTTAQLRKTRQISSSKKRDRLPTREELIALTNYFAERWKQNRYSSKYPMHLIMWFAIFSCRREAELTRLFLKDNDLHHSTWKVHDLKNPNGSKGNHKFFDVLDSGKEIIKRLMHPDVRERMLKLGHDENLLLPLNPKSMGKEFREACKMLGIEDLRFHDLRHEGCTRLAEQSFTIPEIQKVSLHDSWSSLQRYVSVKARRNVMQFEEVLRLIDET